VSFGALAQIGRFHAYKSVTPLKQGDIACHAHRAPRFHAYKSVAPLKRPEIADRMLRTLVSTLTKAWPH